MIRNLIYKIKVKLGLVGHDGFTELRYNVKPLILRNEIPVGMIGFVNRETATVRLLNWKTKKFSKKMSYNEFEDWIAKRNKLETKVKQ